MLFKNIAKWYFNLWIKLADFKERANIFFVNFSNSWWKIISDQKRYIFYIIFTNIIETVFFTLIPQLIGVILNSQNYNYFVLFIVAGISVTGMHYLSDYFTALVQMRSICSLQYYAHRYFLTVDPIYHTTRESGTIIGKIDRGVDSFEEIVSIVTTDFLPTIVGVITVAIALFHYDSLLAIIGIVLITIIGLINVSLQVLTNQAFEHEIINASDQLNNVSVENLSEINFIRSTFASNKINQILKRKNKTFLRVGGAAWLAFSGMNFLTHALYMVSLFILGSYLISLMRSDQISALTATGLILTYINGSKEILKLGRKIKRYLRSLTRVNDLFNFISNFGKQSFPVLDSLDYTANNELLKTKNNNDKLKEENIKLACNKDYKVLSVDVTNIGFNYSIFDKNNKNKVSIFSHHSFHLDVPHNQEYKLYGIIGPSGIGKTTLLSILGGQLKPQSGTVEVQGINIYKISDNIRRCLIAMQGQIASSLKGTIKYNLTFGLPFDINNPINIYTDGQLISVLEKVGLWPILSEKEGLNTQVGESGLTLSGGQRQRLNFANLYLRASYYKPFLILIDEPTSSLDEISEKAITGMIKELSTFAITLVIAHRLKTIEGAQGIIDFSLIRGHNKIMIYSKDELKNISDYFKKLMAGKIKLNKDKPKNC